MAGGAFWNTEIHFYDLWGSIFLQTCVLGILSQSSGLGLKWQALEVLEPITKEWYCFLTIVDITYYCYATALSKHTSLEEVTTFVPEKVRGQKFV